MLVTLTPAGVVTLMWTFPAAWAGVRTVSDVADSTCTLVPVVVPKTTWVAPVSCIPVTVTVVPPASGPDAGLIPVTKGLVL